MNDPAHVFVYGTLLSGLPADPRRPDLCGHLVWAGRRSVQGALVNLSPYPGLVAGTGWVRGERWCCVSEEALGILDAWEEYRPAAPAGSLYRRRLVTTDRDEVVWAYWWNGAATAHRIPSGGWRAWRRASRPDVDRRARVAD